MVEMTISALLVFLWLLVVALAVTRVVQSAATPLNKALWVAVLVLFPVVGAIVWLLIGPAPVRHRSY